VSLRDRMRSDLMTAMKTKDRTRTTVLRSALAAIDNAGAVAGPTTSMGIIGYGDVARRDLDHPQELDVLEAEILERETAFDAYLRIEQHDAAETLREEIDVLRSYLDGD